MEPTNHFEVFNETETAIPFRVRTGIEPATLEVSKVSYLSNILHE